MSKVTAEELKRLANEYIQEIKKPKPLIVSREQYNRLSTDSAYKTNVKVL